MERLIEREFLDDLPPGDAGAVGSRKDLERLNTWMGNAGIMARALRRAFPGNTPRRIVELGAGDGNFMLQVARRLSPEWQGSRVVLLDQQSIVSSPTRSRFESLGWQVETVEADAFDWLNQSAMQSWDAIVANLFLHHFSEEQLVALFCEAEKRTRLFVAIEPRRNSAALAFSRMVWFIGCNKVTRHDAPTSVRGGFAGVELSQLWPAGEHWKLQERRAGPFSHLFIAKL